MKRSTASISASDVIIMEGYPREGDNGLEVLFYIQGATNADVPLESSIVHAAIVSAQTQIANDMGVAIQAVQDPSSQGIGDNSTNTIDYLLLTVLPGTVAGGFALICIVFAVILLFILWYVLYTKNGIIYNVLSMSSNFARIYKRKKTTTVQPITVNP